MNKIIKLWIGLLAAVIVVLLGVWVLAQERPGAPGRGEFRPPVVMGTVTAVYPDKNTIAVQSLRDQSTAWIAVTNQTQITKQVKGTVADLKLKEDVTIVGQPTNIIANEIQVGVGMPFGMMGKGKGPESPQPPRGPAAGPFGMMGARITGTITNLKPLTITLPDKTTVTVSLAKDAKILKNVKATLKDIKKGDQIMAFGQFGSNGYLYATTIRAGEIFPPMPGRPPQRSR